MDAHSPALAGANPDMPTCCCPVPRLRTGPGHHARAMVPSGTPKRLKLSRRDQTQAGQRLDSKSKHSTGGTLALCCPSGRTDTGTPPSEPAAVLLC